MSKNARNDRSIVLEELLLISNLAHSEIHLYELLERTNKKEVISFLNKILEQVKNLRIKSMKISDIKNIEIIWCSLKHLLLSYIHCIEIYEKNKNPKYLEISKTIMMIIDDLISKENLINEKNILKCPRCIEKNKS